jgi:L-idonate 5-dehydrogenase
MAEAVLAPARNLFPLPRPDDFAHGTLVEPLAVAIHAVAVAGNVRGKVALIAGSGPIGLLTLVALKEAGVRAVIVTEPAAMRRETALKLGATAALDPAADDWRDAVAAIAGRPEVDLSVDAAGVAATFGQCVELTRPGGVIVAVGGWKTVPIDLARVVGRELRIVGSFNFTQTEFIQAQRWLAEERFDPRCLVTEVYPLALGAQVFAELATHGTSGIKTVLANIPDPQSSMPGDSPRVQRGGHHD